MKTDVDFRAYPRFNQDDAIGLARSRHRVGKVANGWFHRDTTADRIARSLAAHEAVHLKELLEAAEFHARLRRRVRRPVVVDLCCGHGLAGLFFATEPSVERVVLIDRSRPHAFERVFQAVVEAVPAVRDKITYVESDLASAHPRVETGCAVLAVHACGPRTDDCITVATRAQAAVIAAMPCCYARKVPGAPAVLHSALGKELLTDVDRTYRLSAAGYTVDWAHIPAAITPMNRILVATLPTPEQGTTAAP